MEDWREIKMEVIKIQNKHLDKQRRLDPERY